VRSREVAEAVGCSERYVRKLTKEAVANKKSFIVVKGSSYSFKLIAGVGGRGEVYEYSKVKEVKRVKRRRIVKSRVDVANLPKIDFSKAKIESGMKLTLLKFIRKEGVSVRAVSKIYGIDSGVSEGSIYKRIYRWEEAYRAKGRAGLEDKRQSYRESKVSDELFMASIIKRANLKSYYLRYAYLDAKERGVELDVLYPEKSCSIAYSTYVKYYNRRKKDPEVKAILNGVDSVDLLEPKFKIKAQYPNEVWEIDATNIDIFVKVPVIDGEVNNFRVIESSEYVLKRFSLVGVVDRFSGARVYRLFRSDTSYSDVRLLEKAINTLGRPDVIKGDNGKNYVSNHFQSVLEDLGITYIAAPPYRGDKKGFIERGFRTMQHNALFENLPGFIGHNTEDRKKIENQAAGKSLKGKSGSGTQTHIKEKFMWWWEAERVIDGLIKHLFKEGLNVHKESLKEFKTIDNLHILLGKKESRKVNFEGVYFEKKYYLNSKLWNYFNIGDEVEVYEEIDDVNRIYVKLADGEFLECVSEDEFEISVEEAKEIKKVYRRKRGKVLKEAINKGKRSLDGMSQEITEQLANISTLEKKEVEKVVKKELAKDSKDSGMSAFDIAVNVGY